MVESVEPPPMFMNTWSAGHQSINLRNPLHARDKVRKQGIHDGFENRSQTLPEVQNRGISGLCPLKKIF